MKIINRIALAKRSLKGLCVGDAFGDSFFGPQDHMLNFIQERKIPPTQWEFTDDTVMGLAIFEELEQDGSINQDRLAQKFATNYQKDNYRGYGGTAHKLLRGIGEGADWRVSSEALFDGMGSMGNGASMRVSPIGAYYFDDLEKVKELAVQSAEVTHANIEAKTGAIAVAIATALATKVGLEKTDMSPQTFIETILTHLPDTDTTAKINKSLSLSYNYHIETVKAILGNGLKIMTQDTVPFSVWCAAHNLHSYEESIWKAVSILGDRDTICAIVGGITVMSANEETVPKEWINAVEDMDESVFRN